MSDLLKFLTCGSVDDGKSTLIGHMLYDAKLLFSDQQKMLELESHNTNGRIDYSLLLDGLMAEREQKITIDVAYRFFTTMKRAFIVADTPGHEEYTRNMAVGASFADLAIILVDINNGIVTQTKRHIRICDFMGIRHFVFAVNKIDLIDYNRERFEIIKAEIESLMKAFDYSSICIIPVSATNGDNVTKTSSKTPWYKGESLLSYLENVDVENHLSSDSFVMPIQRVSRPNSSFRGYQGQIEVGEVNVGDEVIVLPSKEKALVLSILESGNKVDYSNAGHSISLTLSKNIDVSRGCVFFKGRSPSLSNYFLAQLLWLDNSILEKQSTYIIKIGTKQSYVTLKEIRHKINVDSGENEYTDCLHKNEIGICDLLVSDQLVIDKFSSNKSLGSFILIDRISNSTVACGIVNSVDDNPNYLYRYKMDINRSVRSKQKNQNPKTIWLTGLSGSGKSTLANQLEKKLVLLGKHTMLLDGDNIRTGINSDLGFSQYDREENIRRVAEIAKILNDAGIIVIVSLISPIRNSRESARVIIGLEHFIEVYVNTPLSICENRDPKGLYKRARTGEIKDFTGISSPYEIPNNPFIQVDTSDISIEDGADYIYGKIKELI